MTKHTIVLIQFTQSRGTRSYNDYETVALAMDGICRLYEEKLQKQYPNLRNITYDINDLNSYIDGLADLSALVYDPNINAYVPHNKDWIKARIFNHLKKNQAQG